MTLDVLPLAGGGPARDARRALPVAAVVPLAGRRGRPRPRAGVPGHHRLRAPRRTGTRRSRSTSRASGRRTRSYWDEHRTTPKAFVPLARRRRRCGGIAWARSRRSALAAAAAATGRRGARRVRARAARAALDPAAGRASRVAPVRAQALAAARGRDDFGEYFLYFSVVPGGGGAAAGGALLPARRRAAPARDRPAARAWASRPARVRRLLVTEGLVLAAGGRAAGLRGRRAATPAACSSGLRTVWIGAVGTRPAPPRAVTARGRRPAS